MKIGDFPLATLNKYAVNNNPTLTSTKIFIIDENPLSRMTARDLLLLDGYQVLEIEDLTQISDRILAEKPALILLDLMSRQIDSLDLCRQLKSDYRTANIPVVLTTLSGDRQDRIKVMEVGGDDVLVKPLNRVELSTRVKSLIQQTQLNDASSQTEQVLFTIAKAVDNRAVSRGSSDRIIGLVKAFGEYLNLSSEDIENLAFAAHLHDIGTIAIPDAVMLKAGELTPAEKELIREHVLFGEEICQPLRNRSGILPIVRHHHERWDGTGYPDGLSATQIPYLAQIFQAIDIYDALTSDRPHKQAYSPKLALEIMLEETRKGWRNPELIEQFATFIRERIV